MKFLSLILLRILSGNVADTVVNLEGVTVSASIKGESETRKLAAAASSFNLTEIENRDLKAAKDLSVSVPNFYQPRYGSRITSSIYIRGFGSRIDQPTMSLIIDNVPIMNKNAFDFDFLDIRRIDVLRGPQGTLYGRNSNGGVMDILTLSPMVWQGTRVNVGFDSEPACYAQISHYGANADRRFGYSLSANFAHHDGFFTNTYNNKKCDAGNSFAVRSKIDWKSGRWDVENTFSGGIVDEGGYAYRQFDAEQNTLKPICYNDTCHYRRTSLIDGLVARYSGTAVDFASVTSYQFLHDNMLLDNDFTAEQYFTLQQEQHEHAVTQEFIAKQHNKSSPWQWNTGVFAFAKWLKTESPVTFKRDGIENLILKNANAGIRTVFPENGIEIADASFPISCRFDIPTVGAAVFHESKWRSGRWQLTAGLRIDFEHARMDYDENCDIHYRFNLTMSNFRTMHSNFKGRETTTSLVALPKLSAQYFFENGSVYFTFANGHKAGGFNTQIFSDIMQSVLMNQMMSELGVTFVAQNAEQSARDTKYEPETNYNFEVGYRYSRQSFSTATTVFWIEGVNQQITVMPEGSGVGRMMSNAGRTRSIGFENSTRFEPGNWSFGLDAGLTDARFRDYRQNDTTNHRGRHVPYAPTATCSVSAKYIWNIQQRWADRITFTIQDQAVGKIFWNESNSLSQPLYTLLSASIGYRKEHFSIQLFAKNIANTRYHTFYFKSVGHEFFADGTPRTTGINLKITI